MRLFVALPLPAAVREEVGRRITAERRRLPAARWTPPENLHLTLVFLGPVDDERVEPLATELAAAFAGHRPMTLCLRGAGCFPPPPPRGKARRARVAWIGVEVEEGVERLEAVQHDVAAAAHRAVDFADEARPFSPHLTLARPREPWREEAVALFTAVFSPPAGDPFVVDHGLVMASQLGRGPGGSSLYRTLRSFPLAGGEAPGSPPPAGRSPRGPA
ncbi:MAG TPA: RNA 2',3'-cyclic phosphodiesterase [Thermoanaerobaculia bacterium]|nr:RNA 2',3'-cyclic phosphodiesterase [Thermoanaerobaculia bacterium]